MKKGLDELNNIQGFTNGPHGVLMQRMMTVNVGLGDATQSYSSRWKMSVAAHILHL